VPSSPWQKLLERPHARGHFVQLYRADDNSLVTNVGRYLCEGLKAGDGTLVIATEENRRAFTAHIEKLGFDVQPVISANQFILLDARQTLEQFMVDGQPDWYRFEAVIRAAMHRLQPAGEGSGLRAYGEMVGLLWNARQFAAAIRLEQYWNKLLEQASFSLYCAYAIDLFGQEFHVANLDGVLCTHTHLVPAESDGKLEKAVNLAMDEVLGSHAEGLKVLIKENYRPGWAIMPNAESIMLWLRNNLPEKAEEIVARARHHYCLLSQAIPAE